eukprot:9488779-Pyramimonas_sp.AAC.1
MTSPCYKLVALDGALRALSQGAELHIAGGGRTVPTKCDTASLLMSGFVLNVACLLISSSWSREAVHS